MTGLKIMNGVDRLVSSITGRLKFFSGGIGDVEFLERVPELLREIPEETQRLTNPILGRERSEGGALINELTFTSPAAAILDANNAIGRAQTVFPPDANLDTPVVIHFAATADESYTPRRLGLALPLARKGIASVILENPFYGQRKPEGQIGPALRTLSDQFKMNTAVVQEGLALLTWLHEQGYRKIGVTGVSQGGSMAASVASGTKLEVACAACLAPYGPGPAFLEGVIKDAVDWPALEASYTSAPGDHRTVRQYVKDLLELPDLRKADIPRNPRAAILVGGSQDAYVLPDSVEELHRHWQGSTLRWIDAGHVSGIFLHHGAFRQAIRDSFALL